MKTKTRHLVLLLSMCFCLSRNVQANGPAMPIIPRIKITLIVGNANESKDWYTNILGFRDAAEIQQYPVLSTPTVYYKIPESNVCLIIEFIPIDHSNAPNSLRFAIPVKEFSHLYSKLLSKKVKIVQPSKIGSDGAAWGPCVVLDNSGNQIELGPSF